MITIVKEATDKTTTVELRDGPCAGIMFFEMGTGELLPISLAMPSSSEVKVDTARTFDGMPVHVRKAAIYMLCGCPSLPKHYHFAGERP